MRMETLRQQATKVQNAIEGILREQERRQRIALEDASTKVNATSVQRRAVEDLLALTSDGGAREQAVINMLMDGDVAAATAALGQALPPPPPGGVGGAAAPAGPPAPAPPKKGKSAACPKCKTKIPVESDVRPIKIECPTCGTKGTLKK